MWSLYEQGLSGSEIMQHAALMNESTPTSLNDVLGHNCLLLLSGSDYPTLEGND